MGDSKGTLVSASLTVRGTLDSLSMSQESELDRLRRQNARLKKRVEELQRGIFELTRSASMIEQRERRRLTEILHDDIQQRIYGIRLRVDLAREDVEAGRRAAVIKNLATVEKWLRESIETLRNLAVDLSPPAVKSESLVEAISLLVAHMNRLHGLEIDLQCDEPIDTSPEARIVLHQAIRELLFNIVKHARVKRAAVAIRRVGDHVEASVADYGVGFDPKRVFSGGDSETGLGLINLRYRLRAFGGTIKIQSSPGDGTRATIKLPLKV